MQLDAMNVAKSNEMQILDVPVYKGFHAKAEYDTKSSQYYGVIDGIHDHVDFLSADIDGVAQEFHAAVDDYVAFCREIGKPPN